MTEQIRRIAATDKFSSMYNAGSSRTEIAKAFGVPVRTISNCCEYLGLRPPGANDLAPTPEEERASRESLELAPMVREAAAEYWRKHLEKLKTETQDASFTRGYDWAAQQNPKTYTIYLSNGTRLA